MKSQVLKNTTEQFGNSTLIDDSHLRTVDVSTLQNVSLTPYSDTNWDITQPSLDQMSSNLNLAYSQIQSAQNILSNSIQVIMQFSFTQSQNQLQNLAPSQGSVQVQLLNSSDIPNSLLVTANLLNLISCASSSTPIRIPAFYAQITHLVSEGTPVQIPGDNNDFVSDVYLFLNCTNSAKFWVVSLTSTNNLSTAIGLIFYTISDRVSTFLLGYSVTAFYLGVVYLIGRVVRTAVSGGEQNLTISDLPTASNIIQICEGILIARADKNLQKEELLYWELVDLLRSPEVLKVITESCVQGAKAKTRKKLE